MEAEKVAELAFRKWSGGNPSVDSSIREADFENAVQTAYAYMVKLDFWNNYKMTGEKEVSQAWLVSYNDVPVLFNKKTETYYSVLPEQVLDLPSNAGVVITPTKNQQVQFKPQTISEMAFFQSNPTDYVTYNRTKTTIEYDNFDSNITSVFMQFVPLIAVDIPDEFTNQIIDLVLNQFLKVKGILVDQIADNSPNVNKNAAT